MSGTGVVVQIDIASGAVTSINDASLNYPQSPSWDGTSLWVVNAGVNSAAGAGPSVLSQINPMTGGVSSIVIPYPVSASAVSSDGTNVWIAGGAVIRYNISSGVFTELSGVNDQNYWIASDGVSVWVGSPGDVWHIEAATGVVEGAVPVGLRSATRAVASDGNYMYVTNDVTGQGYVQVFDIATGTVTEVDATSLLDCNAVAVYGGVAWVLNPVADTLTEIVPGP
jgi:DNA-binding beta-propeller fold protein YncE